MGDSHCTIVKKSQTNGMKSAAEAQLRFDLVEGPSNLVPVNMACFAGFIKSVAPG